MTENIKNIINMISKYNDNMLYLLVFNTLTDKNAIKNYTNNSNGIFFNMNSINDSLINILTKRIKSYLEIKENININEIDRSKILKDMRETLINESIETKEDLEKYISDPCKIFSTSIKEKKTESKVKEVHRQSKKRQDFYLQKPVYKGSKKRIDSLLRSSNRGYRVNNIFTEENETIDDYCCVEEDDNNTVDDIEELVSDIEELAQDIEELDIIDDEDLFGDESD